MGLNHISKILHWATDEWHHLWRWISLEKKLLGRGVKVFKRAQVDN